MVFPLLAYCDALKKERTKEQQNLRRKANLCLLNRCSMLLFILKNATHSWTTLTQTNFVITCILGIFQGLFFSRYHIMSVPYKWMLSNIATFCKRTFQVFHLLALISIA